MDIQGTTALVTGANRGIGRHFAQQLLDRGAAKVYAAARDPRAVDLPGVTPIQLDVTDPASIAAAAELAGDVTLLINNAGVSHWQSLLTGDLDITRLEMETNYFGVLGLTRAFAPILAAGGGGAVLNVLSAMSWAAFEGVGGYGASKAAGWSLTNNLRVELTHQGTQVTGLYLASTDTDMMAAVDVPKNDPAEVVRVALDGVQRGELEVLVDDDTRAAKAALSLPPSATAPSVDDLAPASA